MSASDLWMRDVLMSYGLFIFSLFLAKHILTWTLPWLRKRSYTYHLLGYESVCADVAERHRRRLFMKIRQLISNDEVLKSIGSLRLLEIGVKTGKNIPFYPKGTRYVGVDRNIKLGDYLTKSSQSRKFSHVKIERLIDSDGSTLKEIPTGSIDVVVTTRSLCSVESVESTLCEIRRVLAPEGRYFFMEHVLNEEDVIINCMQKLLTRTGVWPYFYGDCRLDLDIAKNIKAAGFTSVSCFTVVLQHYNPSPLWLALTKRHVIGIAKR